MSVSSELPVAAFGVKRSLSGRRWRLIEADEVSVRSLALSANVSRNLARLLVARGVAAHSAAGYLAPKLKQLLPEPMSLMDMEKAVTRTSMAIVRKEKLAIFGDYDVDGSASAAILLGFLSSIGISARVYIPDRMTEGYGPSTAALSKLQSEGASLVVTVDCGAGATSALESARSAGLDVIVLDHHAVEASPPAFAHVNPNQPGDTSGLGYVCAAGITFLFVVALNRALRNDGWYARQKVEEPDLMRFVDLVGLATVCDVVPLIGVNRAFVRAGVSRMARLDRIGMAALAEVAEIAPPFTPYHLGFVLGPRINAGGRVGRSSLGVDLLAATEPQAAREFAHNLDRHNRERQAIEKLILDETLAKAVTQENSPFVFVAEAGWHAGVVGIVAGRLKERFGKPAFVAGFEGGLGRGSARSIAGIDIGAIVRAAKDKKLIDGGGGHAMAAGFTLRPEQTEPFRAFLAQEFAKSDALLAAAQDMSIEIVVAPSAASVTLVDEIARAGPFGAGNFEPLVLVPDVKVRFAGIVGNDHIRLRLAGGDGSVLDAVAFRHADSVLGKGLLAARERAIHAVGRLRADEWNGQRRVQLQIEDAALVGV